MGGVAEIWELTKIPYVLLAIASVELVVQDLRVGHIFGIVISPVPYGSALVILPLLSWSTVKASDDPDGMRRLCPSGGDDRSDYGATARIGRMVGGARWSH